MRGRTDSGTAWTSAPATRAQPEVTKAAISETETGAKLSIGLVEESALARVINLFTQKDVKVMNLSKREPTLEDVFVDLVGRSMAEEESNESA